MAIRGLAIIGISTRGGLVTIGNTVPNPGGKVIMVGSSMGTWKEKVVGTGFDDDECKERRYQCGQTY